MLGGGHGHVGGAEVDLPGAERGDARAAAHGRVADGHRRILLTVFREGEVEERRANVDPDPVRVTVGPTAATEAWADGGLFVLVVLVVLVHAPRAMRASAAAAA